jgi:hypothetical protein
MLQWEPKGIKGSKRIAIVGMDKETIKTDGCKFLLVAFQYVDISKRNIIQNNRRIQA